MGFWKKSDEEFEKEIEKKIHTDKQEKIRGELETERIERDLSRERELLNKEKSQELNSVKLQRIRNQRKGGSSGGFLNSARNSIGSARDSIGKAVDMFVPAEKQRSMRSGGILGASGFDVGGGKSFNIMGSSGMGLGGSSSLWGSSMSGSPGKSRKHKVRSRHHKRGRTHRNYDSGHFDVLGI